MTRIKKVQKKIEKIEKVREKTAHVVAESSTLLQSILAAGTTFLKNIDEKTS